MSDNLCCERFKKRTVSFNRWPRESVWNEKKNRVVCTDLCSAPPAAGGNEHCVNWHDTINTNSFFLFAGRRWDLKGGEPAERFKLMTAKNTHEEIMKETCPVKEKQAFICRFKGQTVKDLTLNPRQDPSRHPVNSYCVHQSQHTSFFFASLFVFTRLLNRRRCFSKWKVGVAGQLPEMV